MTTNTEAAGVAVDPVDPVVEEQPAHEPAGQATKKETFTERVKRSVAAGFGGVEEKQTPPLSARERMQSLADSGLAACQAALVEAGAKVQREAVKPASRWWVMPAFVLTALLTIWLVGGEAVVRQQEVRRLGDWNQLQDNQLGSQARTILQQKDEIQGLATRVAELQEKKQSLWGRFKTWLVGN